MTKSAVALTFAIALMAAPAYAHDDVTPPMSADAIAGVRPLVDTFFTTLKSGDASKAYTDLFADTLVSGKVLELQNLVAQSNFLFQTYGEIQAWTLARSDCFSPNFCRAIYQVDTHNGPIFLILTLYRRDTGWMATTVLVSDISTNLFD